ncbi:hypothetical protein CORC01_13270 [Colletotrichum orchidophilum]|uniref:Uncharacterized protein n=1 Tax=Colletotrichum orchidophilum TaxID=1209926 RepID=A0A1G4AQS2_9PEZI|nr:uncharacterized protein CORC01_13270 [Colletotrichum orchidophilum]OHE91451.1 hypothetical protein CORC01_13270 [Colletotrichum orchidophilum]
MVFFKSQVLPYLALVQLCAAAAIDNRDIARRATAFRDNYGSNMCLQVECDTTICAESVDDALAVASGGVSLIVGPDCAGWKDGAPTELAPGNNGTTCPKGRKLYRGSLMVWRAWSNVSAKKDYHAEFLEWENFKGAQCWGRKDVQCQKDGVKMAPDPNTAICEPWGL